ncbi:MAG: diguanylate cyclase domain-containing protein [Anaerolineaceae bacterium]
MLNKTISQNKLILHVVMLAVGLIISAGMIVFVDEQTVFLGLSLLAFVVVLTLFKFNRWMDWIAWIVCILAYGYVQYTFQEPMMQLLTRVGVFAAALLISSILARTMHNQIVYFIDQYTSNSNLIEELTLHDAYGLLKWKLFQQKLDEEFVRSRRTKKPVSVMMMRVFNYQKLVAEGHPGRAEELMEVTAKVCKKILRTLDVVSRYDKETLGMILPDTSDEEAKIAAARVVQGAAQQINASVYAGIASFPIDAVSFDKIISRAQTALDFAVNSEKEMVSYAQMNIGKAKEKK